MFQDAVVFLFLPHQDDEISVLSIWKEIARSREVYVFCITNGEVQSKKRRHNRDVRNKELVVHLGRLNITKENIFFLSDNLPPNDQCLHEFTDEIITNVQRITERLPAPDIVIYPAMEGGHPDHDVSNILIRHIFSTKTNSPTGYEYYIYSRSTGLFPFNISTPLSITQEHEGVRFNRWQLIRVMRAIRTYKSQFRTFLVLGPCLLVRWLFSPTIYLRHCKLDGTPLTPPPSPNLYEWRGWVSFKEIQAVLDSKGFSHLIGSDG